MYILYKYSLCFCPVLELLLFCSVFVTHFYNGTGSGFPLGKYRVASTPGKEKNKAHVMTSWTYL